MFIRVFFRMHKINFRSPRFTAASHSRHRQDKRKSIVVYDDVYRGGHTRGRVARCLTAEGEESKFAKKRWPVNRGGRSSACALAG